MDQILTETIPGAMSLAEIIALWERLLDLSPIGADDDFFDLGGDSLLALNLFHEIERQTGRALPITAIYEATTPAKLADLLTEADPAPFSPLVLVKPGDDQPPFFMVHGIGGNVIELEKCGRLIASPRPVYAVQAKGVDGGEEPFDRVEAMVAYDLAAIRAVQPHGPYFLGGYSFGGLIAMEMARRLRAEGETVALLAFIDSYAHPQTFPKSARQLIRLRVTLDAFRTKPFGEACASTLQRLKGRGGAASQPDLVLANFPTAATTPALRKVYEAAFAALLAYWPQPYDGDIVFFRPRTSIFPIAPATVWRKLVHGLDVRAVAGDHDSMMREHAAELAAALTRAIDEASQTR